MVYTFLDIETNGLDINQDSPIQFAYLEMTSSGLFLRRRSYYINITSDRWSEGAQDAHHITREFLKQHGIEETRAAASMYSVLANCYPVTYNGQTFDLTLLRNFFRRKGISGPIPTDGFDVMREWQKFYGGRNKKLTTVCEELGIPPAYIATMTKQLFKQDDLTRAHDASYDVVATMLVFKRLKAELNKRAQLQKEQAEARMRLMDAQNTNTSVLEV